MGQFGDASADFDGFRVRGALDFSHWHPQLQERNFSPKTNFRVGYPQFAWLELQLQSFGQVLETENKHSGADILGPTARTCMTAAGENAFGQKNLGLMFSFSVTTSSSAPDLYRLGKMECKESKLLI